MEEPYSSTCNGPPYDGEIVFSSLEAETLSGTFSFKASGCRPLICLQIFG